jgi:hypothetical protein
MIYACDTELKRSLSSFVFLSLSSKNFTATLIYSESINASAA